MKSLIVEDESSSRSILQMCLEEFGEVDLAVDGVEAVGAVYFALLNGVSYDLIILDILTPKMTGVEALKSIRDLEGSYGLTNTQSSRVLITMAPGVGRSIMGPTKNQCDGYLVKPVSRDLLCQYLENFALVGA